MIILDAVDLAAALAEEWNQLNPLAILWNETALAAPDRGWIPTRQYGQVEVTTNGVTMTLEYFK